MVNEAERLHFTRRPPLFSQKPQAFLHIFTKTTTALLVKPLLSVACEEVRSADREVSRSASKVGIWIYRAAPLLKSSVVGHTFSPGNRDGNSPFRVRTGLSIIAVQPWERHADSRAGGGGAEKQRAYYKTARNRTPHLKRA